MAKINLKDYYYWYTQDEFIEVSDEVEKALLEDKRYERAYRRRTFYNDAHYSLDADDGIEEKAILDPLDDPANLLLEKEQICSLCRALNSLSDIQGRRIEAVFILGIKRNVLAEREGVSESSLNESIACGLQQMKIFLKNTENHPVKCP